LLRTSDLTYLNAPNHNTKDSDVGSDIWNRGSRDEPNPEHDPIPCETNDDELDEVAKANTVPVDALVPKDSNSWPWFD